MISGGWMIGPAFIKAADRASPQGSITPGKARRNTAKACASSPSGNTPVGRRLARIVIATSNGPCLRVSHGSVPVSAYATRPVAGFPRGLRENNRAECAGRQEHDLAGGQMRRKLCRLCRPARARGRSKISIRRPDRRSNVVRDQREPGFMAAAKIFDDDAAAGRSVRCDRLPSRRQSRHRDPPAS